HAVPRQLMWSYNTPTRQPVERRETSTDMFNMSTFGKRTWFLEDSAQGKSPVAATDIPLTANSLSLHLMAFTLSETRCVFDHAPSDLFVLIFTLNVKTV
ncbi:hypothetical protein, partial [Escherichia coli]|uniref:hypothetical protein n=1 Tax=Escherichia coli TaxID=562 RepID=UPI001BC8B4EA